MSLRNLSGFTDIKNSLLSVIFPSVSWGWSDGAKVTCILCHQGVQLILAYSWARPAILVAGKGRGGMFLLCPRHFQWGGI